MKIFRPYLLNTQPLCFFPFGTLHLFHDHPGILNASAYRDFVVWPFMNKSLMAFSDHPSWQIPSSAARQSVVSLAAFINQDCACSSYVHSLRPAANGELPLAGLSQHHRHYIVQSSKVATAASAFANPKLPRKYFEPRKKIATASPLSTRF